MKRQCNRFVIFGATLTYKKEGIFSAGEFTKDVYPILNLSLGGLLFLSQQGIKPDTNLSLKICGPDGDVLLILKGVVVWVTVNPEKSYSYQIGVQFKSYGEKKGNNPPGCLNTLLDLERRYSKENH